VTSLRSQVTTCDFFDLAPEDAVPDQLEGVWWVAHTRARNEKALARELERLSIFHYLPLQRRATRSRRSGRTHLSTVPVFAGYLFFNATEAQRYRVMATNRVANTLFVPDQQQLVAQIRNVHRVLLSDTAIEQFCGIRVGQWVRVVAGPLMGVEGRVMRRLGRTRLVVTVDILGQSVTAEVDAELLERIDPPDTEWERQSRLRASGGRCDPGKSQ
jgi:transcription antitermination factor NusG